MKFSLGMILALCLAGLQFVAVTIVVFSSFLTSERVLLDHARDLLSDVGNNTIAHSIGFLKPAKGAAELATRLAENRVISSDDRMQLEKLLFQQLQISPQFSGLFYGDEQGDFVYVMRSSGPGPFRTKVISHIDGLRTVDLIWRGDDHEVIETRVDPTDLYDPRNRLWYIDARAKKQSIWTDPYIFFTSQQPGITAASPVFNASGDIRGIVGVDIGIHAISEFLSRLQIGESGKALILNQNGDVIAHPDKTLIRKENPDGTFRFVNIGEIEDPVARAAFGHLGAREQVSVEEEVSSRFNYEGATYVSMVMPIISQELPWTIAVYAPESDFTGEIKNNRTQNVWIAAFIALMTGVFGLVLANYIHKPVRAFAVRASLVSQGEVSASDPLPKTYRELERANETLVEAIAERKISEAEFGRTFDLASRGMAQIQAGTGKFIRVNSKFAAMLGYSETEILQLSAHDISHPDDPVSAFFFEEGEHEKSGYLHEKRLLCKDGDIIWVSENVIVIRDDGGKSLHAVVTVDDITERKAAEREIQQLHWDLSHSARVNVMGQMATSLAHELNQPLLAITQNMDAALYALENKAVKPEDLRAVLRETDRHAHRAGDIIKALRGFVKKDGVEKADFDFEELLEQTLHLMRSEARDKGIKISIQAHGLDPVYGSRVQIAQVLMNLLRNAIEAVAESQALKREVVLKAENTETGVQISVTDTGPGFDEGANLFEQFETTKDDGMGLGLSICRTIVEAHGGKLWYEPDAQGMARFLFSLPALAPKPNTMRREDVRA
ncbi:Adaptive-response sensory-kinase SasA [Roseobacter fucihabitans]|uniref:histidine kinase n=1 Tax=Roseobacter fucihabitans TaxID=1537242 RepID=A0ABZ2BR47_9RHOB|nr:cache domain-containing protein [Roseobacter litoralis]MBC6965455.1 Sensor histidine kinase TodS [Roseobacter litoralis]